MIQIKPRYGRTTVAILSVVQHFWFTDLGEIALAAPKSKAVLQFMSAVRPPHA